jgi:hypothetical protein
MNSITYPTLAAIACDVLAMTASTVASESAFSMGARTVTDFRSRLSVESVEATTSASQTLSIQSPPARSRPMLGQGLVRP